MFKFDFGKYRGIIISVALFLLLDASVLLLNFYISFEIADDAVDVNLAGRQRMLSQRMAKSLFVLDSAQDEPAVFNAALDELTLSQSLFDETLTGFLHGGLVRDASQAQVTLNRVVDTRGQAALQQAETLWLPYKDAIDQLLSDAQAKRSLEASLAAATQMARTHNLELLKLMNDLTISLEQVATSKATRLRWIQTVGISLAIINFLFILLHFVRQLRDSDAVLESARRETTEILDTVNEGLFLVDRHLIIGEQHSAKLREVLGDHTFGGTSFQTLLTSIVSAKDAETARNFIELLFDSRIKEKLIGDLNPLNQIQVNIAQESGGFLTKHLKFDFARAYQQDEISHVLVTVVDISEQIKLEKALAESRKHNESQLEMLTGLLHTHPSLLKEFLDNSYQCFNRINRILGTPAKSSTTMREKITDIFREIHNFKGEAASLKLAYFENAAHAFEDQLAQLRSKADLVGNDYLPLTVQLEQLISYTQQVELLVKKLGQFGKVTQNLPANADAQRIVGTRRQDGWDHLHEFVEHLALRNGKLVRLVSSGLHEIAMSPETQQQLKDICVQMLRNAVVHGIESPYDRELCEKPAEGRIDLRLAKLSANEMELSVMDDGRGLDYAAIRQHALDSGKWSEAEIESWGNKQLLRLIFNEGFTTATSVTPDAGRGVGMDLVMNHVLNNRGKISVSSQRGRHCRFVITLPLATATNEIAA